MVPLLTIKLKNGITVAICCNMLQYVAITPIIPQSCANHVPIMCPYRCQLEAMAARALCHPRGWSCEHHNLGHGRCQTRSLSVPALEFRGSGPSSRPLCPNQSSGCKYWIHMGLSNSRLVVWNTMRNKLQLGLQEAKGRTCSEVETVNHPWQCNQQ